MFCIGLKGDVAAAIHRRLNVPYEQDVQMQVGIFIFSTSFQAFLHCCCLITCRQADPTAPNDPTHSPTARSSTTEELQEHGHSNVYALVLAPFYLSVTSKQVLQVERMADVPKPAEVGPDLTSSTGADS